MILEDISKMLEKKMITPLYSIYFWRVDWRCGRWNIHRTDFEFQQTRVRINFTQCHKPEERMTSLLSHLGHEKDIL